MAFNVNVHQENAIHDLHVFLGSTFSNEGVCIPGQSRIPGQCSYGKCGHGQASCCSPGCLLYAIIMGYGALSGLGRLLVQGNDGH